jgi:hypothetical protein
VVGTSCKFYSTTSLLAPRTQSGHQHWHSRSSFLNLNGILAPQHGKNRTYGGTGDKRDRNRRFWGLFSAPFPGVRPPAGVPVLQALGLIVPWGIACQPARCQRTRLSYWQGEELLRHETAGQRRRRIYEAWRALELVSSIFRHIFGLNMKQPIHEAWLALSRPIPFSLQS